MLSLIAILFSFLCVTHSLPLGKDNAVAVHDSLSVKKDQSADINITFDVTETFLVFVSGTCRIYFQESFCNGRNFSVYDNGVFIVTIETGLQKFCGVNTSSYIPIVYPVFGEYTHPISAGFHNITVVTVESPLLDRSASLRITFFPGLNSKLNMISSTSRAVQSN
jgi:hypothetical protein